VAVKVEGVLPSGSGFLSINETPAALFPEERITMTSSGGKKLLFEIIGIKGATDHRQHLTQLSG